MKNFDIRIWANCWQPNPNILIETINGNGHNNFPRLF
jgi:hypothetical protein